MALDPVYVGEPLSADMLNTFGPAGVIAQGNRGSNKSFTTTETGYLRIDGVSLVNGKSYWVVASNLRCAITGTRTANDHAKFNVRADYTGAAATTSSAVIGQSEISTGTPTVQNDSFPTLIATVEPSADVTASFLLAAIETNPTTADWAVQADAGGIWLKVIDLGWAVADTGVDV